MMDARITLNKLGDVHFETIQGKSHHHFSGNLITSVRIACLFWVKGLVEQCCFHFKKMWINNSFFNSPKSNSAYRTLFSELNISFSSSCYSLATPSLFPTLKSRFVTPLCWDFYDCQVLQKSNLCRLHIWSFQNLTTEVGRLGESSSSCFRCSSRKEESIDDSCGSLDVPTSFLSFRTESVSLLNEPLGVEGLSSDFGVLVEGADAAGVLSWEKNFLNFFTSSSNSCWFSKWTGPPSFSLLPVGLSYCFRTLLDASDFFAMRITCSRVSPRIQRASRSSGVNSSSSSSSLSDSGCLRRFGLITCLQYKIYSELSYLHTVWRKSGRSSTRDIYERRGSDILIPKSAATTTYWLNSFSYTAAK